MKSYRNRLIAGLAAGALLTAGAAFAEGPAKAGKGNKGGWPAGAPDMDDRAPMHEMRGPGQEGRRPGGPGHGPGFGHGVDGFIRPLENPRVAEKLGLSEEQIEAIKTDRESRKESLDATHESLKEARQELHELLTGATDPDSSTVEALSGKIAVLEGEIQRQHLGHVVAVRQILTDEQETKLRETLKQHMEGRPGDDGPRFRRPGGPDDRPEGAPEMDGGTAGPGGEGRFQRPRGPRPDGARPDGARPDGAMGPEGRRGDRMGQFGGREGRDGRGPEAMQRRFAERLANASPEEAAEIRANATERLMKALEKLEEQQSQIENMLKELEASEAAGAAATEQK